MSEYFPEPKSLGRRVKVELDSSNYATKADLKTATGVDTSKYAKKVDLANLKSNVDKLDIDKLKNVPTNLSNLKSKVDKLDADKLLPVPDDLSKLSDLVKNDVVKKDVYNAKIKNIEDKMPDITNLATNASLNAKINEVEGEIPNITYLATNAFLNTKIYEVKGEIPKLNELSKKVKVTLTNGLTKDLINKFSILNGAKYFSLGIFQNYLVFKPTKKYIKYMTGTTRIEWWKSNGMSEQSIENINKSDSDFAPTFVDHHLLPDMTFNEHCMFLFLKK